MNLLEFKYPPPERGELSISGTRNKDRITLCDLHCVNADVLTCFAMPENSLQVIKPLPLNVVLVIILE